MPKYGIQFTLRFAVDAESYEEAKEAARALAIAKLQADSVDALHLEDIEEDPYA